LREEMSQARARHEAEAARAAAEPKPDSIADAAGAEIDRMRQELSMLRNTLPARDRELAQLRDEMSQARQQAEAAQAAAARKTEEAARTALADARAQAQAAIAAATQRAENAERALAENQNAPAADVPRWDDTYVDGLRRDISALRAALVNREVELGHARAALDQARVQQVVPHAANAPIRRFAGPNDEPEETQDGGKRTMVREFAIMVGVLVPAILAYPYLAGYLPDGVRSGIATVTGGLLSAGVERAAPPPQAVVPPPRVIVHPTAIVTRTAKVRATPAVTAATVVTLPRDAVVNVLEQRGNWTFVEIPAQAGAANPQQGWIFNAYLKSPTVAAPSRPVLQTPVKPANLATRQAASAPVNQSQAANPVASQVVSEPASQAAPEPVSAPASPPATPSAN